MLLTIIATVVIVVAVLTPERVSGRGGDPRLTTFSAQPMGARLVYELAGRMGWTVSRAITPHTVADSTVIHAVLSPVVPLRMVEVHALLDAVRGGGALLVVLPGDAGPLNDSLHVRFGTGAVFAPPVALDVSDCRREAGGAEALWPDDSVRLYSLRWTAPPPRDRVAFIRFPVSPGKSTGRAAVVGYPLGRGRVVVASDPDVLRNDVLRVCRNGLSVAAVRALEYLRDGGPAPRWHLVFDEYHQGFGEQPGTYAAIVSYLGNTASGHVLLQLLGAGLLLLAAAASRGLAPRDDPRVERRSPLEHVDALARAYAQVGATRTAASRLVRGVRRRIGRAASRATAAGSDDEFLAWVAGTAPELATDAARVRHALGTPVSRRELAAVGAALSRVESSLTRRPL